MSGIPSWAASDGDKAKNRDGAEGTILAQINDAMRGLRFGQVSVIIHDGVVVQIDRLEKHRLQKE